MTAPRDLIVGLVGPSVDHRMIDGDNLYLIRDQLGLTQQEFADQCGWTRENQSKIERLGKHEVPTATAETVLAAIDHFAKVIANQEDHKERICDETD